MNIVTGTLTGAKRARIREVGADAYKSYGVLAQWSEKDIRLLIDHMITEGYVIQTDGEYSVLQMGDIHALREESTHVIVRKAKAREETAGKQKIKSTDVLTSAGYRLFERLRQLRLGIAKEEAMPPYIIFSDKTLIDMCVRLPKDQREMLMVSGVGAHKYSKYGQRFLTEITVFMRENPSAVLSTPAE